MISIRVSRYALICAVAFTLPTVLEAATLNADNELELQEAQLAYGQCLANPAFSNQFCFKLFLDPGYVVEGIFEAEGNPGPRFGDVASLTFFDGYTGNGEFSRLDEQNVATFEIPVTISDDQRPEEDPGSVAIFLLEVADGDRPSNGRVFVTLDGRDVTVFDFDTQEEIEAAGVVPREWAVFNVALDPQQVVSDPPPDVSGFTPSAEAYLVSNLDGDDNGLFNVTIEGTFEGLTSQATGVQLHGLADIGENADVLIELADIQGETDGTFSGSGLVDQDQLGGLLSGLGYVQIDTVQNPAGEVRGQLVPEPSSAGLLACGVIAWMGFVRRRRAKTA